MSVKTNSFFSLKPSHREKIESLLKEMTLTEKIQQMSQTSWKKLVDKPYEEILLKSPYGSLISIRDPELSNRLQKLAVEKSRLGIPFLFGDDVIHGMRTVFPIPLAESCSWDLDLIEKTGKIAGVEAASTGVHWTFAPMVDICIDPRWGRIAEGAGEDPLYGGKVAAARVKGIQSATLPNGRRIAACVKHFAGYGACQGGRDYSTTWIPDHIFRSEYMNPYQRGIETGAATVMTSYNDINHVPSTIHTGILIEILRKEWGFDGVVVTDWDSLGQAINQGLLADGTEVAKAAIGCEVDLEMVSGYYGSYLEELVNKGIVAMESIDRAVERVLKLKAAIGLFDNPYIDEGSTKSILLNDGHLAIAREMARKSMVLLKNKNSLLPLDSSVKSIALIGPLADAPVDQCGTWNGHGKSADVVTVLKAFRDYAGQHGIELLYSQGCPTRKHDRSGIADAAATARKADIVVLALGESRDMSGEANSRVDLTLPGVQQELLEKVSETGVPNVVCIFSGRPLALPWAERNCDAIIQCWHPGTMGGPALVDLLSGEAAPTGRLSITIPRHVGQTPIYYRSTIPGRGVKDAFDEDGNTTWNGSGYVDCPSTPLYPFGYGLTYTDFSYDSIELSNSVISHDSPITVSAAITNIGKVDGEETVQLYIRDMQASLLQPRRALIDFQKVTIQAGEMKRVSFTIHREQLGFWADMKEYRIEPGRFKVWIASNSTDGVEGEFELV